MTVEEAIAVIEQVIERGQLTKVQALVFRQAWEGRSYLEIAKVSGYDAGYIKDTGSKLWQILSEVYGVRITKLNFQGVLKRVVRNTEQVEAVKHASVRRLDWGEAIDVSIFYGRTDELITLHQWILRDRCRLVTLLGMGGMGKTSLSVKIAEQVQDKFESVVWRSLRDAPLLEDLLSNLICFLAQAQPEKQAQDSPLPETISGKLSDLIEQLRLSKTLVILDNFDAVLQSGKRAGTYRSGYEEYGELLKRLGEISHQSCVLLTTREKPQEIAAQEGNLLPVRTLPLLGMDAEAGYQIVFAKGLTATAPDLDRLVAHYRGSPLALKIAATSIRDLFEGNIAQFLHQGSSAFSGIGTLLQQQCDRLSPMEQQLMYWLAINREPVDCSQLQADIIPTIPRLKLLDLLESLRWRGLIECASAGFTQQPVVMECITERLIEQVSGEIVAETPSLFSSHALMKAQVKDYIRDSQIRVIVQPVIDRLATRLGSSKQIEHKLHCLPTKLREQPIETSGYGGGNLLNLYRQLETDITGYDFSGLSIRQAYLQDVNLHQVDFSAAEFDQCAFASTLGGVTSVAFNSDGQKLATSDTTGGIQIWRVADGQQITSCKGHNNWAWNVAFSPIHPILASCGQDHQVRLWDIGSGECLKVLAAHTGIVTAIAYSPDGNLLASTSGDQTIRVWDVVTGDCRQVLRGHDACVWSVVFHPNGKTLFSAGEDNAIWRWEIETGACLSVWTGHQHWIRAIALSPDGETIASASFDQTIKLWDLETGTCLDTLTGHHKTVTSVSFSADGQFLASGSYDQTIKLWDLETRRCLKTLQKHTHSIWAVAFHPHDDLLASGGEDYTARLWNFETGRCTKTLQGHSNKIYSIALHSTQRLLASSHEDQTIKLWDFDRSVDRQSGSLTVKTKPFRVLRGHRGRILSVAFSPSRHLLASASTDRTIKLWNPDTGEFLQTLQGHTSWVWAIAFHPTEHLLASASYDQTIKLWDVEADECRQTLQEHSSSVLSIAFSPDGNWLASGGYNQTIKLWNVATGKCHYTWQAHLNRVWTVAFSPDSRWLATSGDDGTIHLWDVATGQGSRTISGHPNQVLSVVFSATGDILYSGGADKAIKAWNIETGECTATLVGNQNWVWSLQHDPHLPLLLSAGQDETINYWSTETGKCLQTLQSPRPYEGMTFTHATGLTEAQEATLKALGASSGAMNASPQPRRLAAQRVS
jgi:WD40 repeat protein